MSRLQPLLAPASICVVGASTDVTRVGGVALAQLRRLGFPGPVYGINPKYGEVQGFACFPDVLALPEAVDCAVLAIAAEQVLPQLALCHRAGIRAAVVFAGGFSETGTDAGRAMQEALKDFSQATGMVIAGPNTLGHANLVTGAYTSFFGGFADAVVARQGRGIAVVSQGGGPSIAIHESGLARGLAFSYFLQSGNEACTGLADYMEYLVDDEHTGAIVAYVEGLENFSQFSAVARRLNEAGKPLIVCKGGETARGAEIAESHTARITGSAAAYKVAFEHLNVIRAPDMEEACEMAYLAGFGQKEIGSRVGILTTSGAFGALISDSLIRRGLDVPRFSPALEADLREVLPSYAIAHNPVDLTANIVNSDASFSASLLRMLESTEIDSVILFSIGSLVDKLADKLIAAAQTTAKLIAVICAGPSTRRGDLQASGIAFFSDTARSAHAIAAMSGWQRGRQARMMEPTGWNQAPVEAAAIIAQACRERRRSLDEQEAKTLLSWAGLDVPAEKSARSADEALQAARQIGFPVVMKILSPAIAHKTEIGGVRVNVPEGEVRATFESIMRSAAAHVPVSDIHGILVQRLESGGAELLLSAVRDPVFGPMLTVGFGGTAAELLADVVQAPGVVDLHKARQMMGSLRLFPLLDGYRGAAPLDVDAAAGALVQLSQLMARMPQLVSVEINPLIVRTRGQGAVAVDALVTLDWDADSGRGPNPKADARAGRPELPQTAGLLH